MLLQDEPVEDEHSCSDTRTSATSVHRRRRRHRGLLIDFDYCAYVVSPGAPQDMAPGRERVLSAVTVCPGTMFCARILMANGW